MNHSSNHGLKSDLLLKIMNRRLKPTASRKSKSPSPLYKNFQPIVSIFLLIITLNLEAQDKPVLDLQKSVDLAMKNNHLLRIRDLQADEKETKWNESRIKALPSLIANSTWQYNQNLGELTISQGELGNLPLSPQMIIPLPFSDLSFPLSKHKTFNAGITLYQPITQLGKIKAGVDVSRTEWQISQKEQEKTALQIRQAVEKLYYAILITAFQTEEAEIKKELAEQRISDAESALKSGKTLDVNLAGLKAGEADEEQKLIRLHFQEEDYRADFRILTGLKTSEFDLKPVEGEEPSPYQDSVPHENVRMNSDLHIASMSRIKAEQGIRAARWSYLPDAGLIAGYTWQKGNKIFPEKNPFIGATIKWNIQDVLLNRQLVNQRKSQLLQSQEQEALLKEQIIGESQKLSRKLAHGLKLIEVATKAVEFRKEEYRIEQDKVRNGLSTPSGVLNAKVSLVKAEADLLSARLNYRMILTDLEILYNE